MIVDSKELSYPVVHIIDNNNLLYVISDYKKMNTTSIGFIDSKEIYKGYYVDSKGGKYNFHGITNIKWKGIFRGINIFNKQPFGKGRQVKIDSLFEKIGELTVHELKAIFLEKVRNSKGFTRHIYSEKFLIQEYLEKINSANSLDELIELMK